MQAAELQNSMKVIKAKEKEWNQNEIVEKEKILINQIVAEAWNFVIFIDERDPVWDTNLSNYASSILKPNAIF